MTATRPDAARLAALIRGWLAKERQSIVEHAAEGMTFMVGRGPAIADLLDRQAARIATLESALRTARAALCSGSSFSVDDAYAILDDTIAGDDESDNER
jgi:hypothetical protein